METKTISTYEQQAIDFMNKYNVSIAVKYLRTGKHFDDDKDERDIYEITLTKGQRSYTFKFGQSINDSGFYYQYKTGKTKFPLDRKYLDKDYLKKQMLGLKGMIKMKDSTFVPDLDIIHYPVEPTPYDILACLTKYEVGTFEDFCADYGYDTDSRKAEKTYNAVKEEWLNVSRLFNDDELAELQEIN